MLFPAIRQPLYLVRHLPISHQIGSHVLEYDFNASSGHWICMTAHLYTRAINEELAPRGITYRQWQVLGCLAMWGDLSQVELADRMNIEPASLVPVLDRMERD